MKTTRPIIARAVFASLVCVLTAPVVVAEDLGRFVDGEISGLVSTYKGLHSHPELSHHEEMTAALLATELRKAGFAVTEHVGKYSDGSQAYGVVAILENGPGPRLLIRTDLDALPIVEETGLSYASHVKSKNPAGQEVGVMHVSVEHAQTSWRAYRDAHCDMVAELFMNGSGKAVGELVCTVDLTRLRIHELWQSGGFLPRSLPEPK